MFGFSDETYIDVASGDGGAGCVSFHREKFVPKGGPDGGDGGKGGDVVFIVKDNLRTLGHLKAVRTYKAENGRPGQGDRCFGRNGKDVEIPVPPGTVIRDAQTGELIKDLTCALALASKPCSGSSKIRSGGFLTKALTIKIRRC